MKLRFIVTFYRRWDGGLTVSFLGCWQVLFFVHDIFDRFGFNTRNHERGFDNLLFLHCNRLFYFLLRWFWLLLFWLLQSRNHLGGTKKEIVIFFLACTQFLYYFLLLFHQHFKINFLFVRKCWCYESAHRVLEFYILRLLCLLSN